MLLCCFVIYVLHRLLTCIPDGLRSLEAIVPDCIRAYLIELANDTVGLFDPLANPQVFGYSATYLVVSLVLTIFMLLAFYAMHPQGHNDITALKLLPASLFRLLDWLYWIMFAAPLGKTSDTARRSAEETLILICVLAGFASGLLLTLTVASQAFVILSLLLIIYVIGLILWLGCLPVARKEFKGPRSMYSCYFLWTEQGYVLMPLGVSVNKLFLGVSIFTGINGIVLSAALAVAYSPPQRAVIPMTFDALSVISALMEVTGAARYLVEYKRLLMHGKEVCMDTVAICIVALLYMVHRLQLPIHGAISMIPLIIIFVNVLFSLANARWRRLVSSRILYAILLVLLLMYPLL